MLEGKRDSFLKPRQYFVGALDFKGDWHTYIPQPTPSTRSLVSVSENLSHNLDNYITLASPRLLFLKQKAPLILVAYLYYLSA